MVFAILLGVHMFAVLCKWVKNYTKYAYNKKQNLHNKSYSNDVVFLSVGNKNMVKLFSIPCNALLPMLCDFKISIT